MFTRRLLIVDYIDKFPTLAPSAQPRSVYTSLGILFFRVVTYHPSICLTFVNQNDDSAYAVPAVIGWMHRRGGNALKNSEL